MLSRLEVFLKHGRVLAFLICFAAVAGAQQSSITPESLRTWLTYLASDDLEGRATFSEGLGLAAAYIAQQPKDAGVKPRGDHGSYFQRVEVLGIKSTNRSTVTVEVNGVRRRRRPVSVECRVQTNCYAESGGVRRVRTEPR